MTSQSSHNTLAIVLFLKQPFALKEKLSPKPFTMALFFHMDCAIISIYREVSKAVISVISEKVFSPVRLICKGYSLHEVMPAFTW